MFICLDIEITGLNPQVDKILEIAVCVTDDALNAKAPRQEIMTYSEVVHHEVATLVMDDVVREMHTKNGLLDEVARSPWSLDDVACKMIAYLQDPLHGIAPKTEPMCGSTISFDRAFLKAQAPRLEAFFHYRNIDVSSFKEVVKRWYPACTTVTPLPGEKRHRAGGDVLDSIRELAHYRATVFRDLR